MRSDDLCKAGGLALPKHAFVQNNLPSSFTEAAEEMFSWQSFAHLAMFCLSHAVTPVRVPPFRLTLCYAFKALYYHRRRQRGLWRMVACSGSACCDRLAFFKAIQCSEVIIRIE